MSKRVPIGWAAVAMAVLLLTSCGESDEATELTPEELAGMRLASVDVGGEWAVTPDLEGHSGLVTEEMKGDLPALPLCEEAGTDAVAAVDGLDWQVLAGFTRGEQESVYTPWMIQLLLSGEPDEIESTFNAIKSGYSACAGVTQTVEGLADFNVEEVPLPAVGDDRVGLRFREVAEENSDRWDSRAILVRQGAVIMQLYIGEINTGAPQVSQAEVDDIVQTAVGRLP